MVTKEQLKAGLAAYIEKEFIAKVGGLRKWAVVLVANEMLVNMDAMLSKLPDNSYVTKDGMVDIDRLYGDMYKVVEKTGPVTEHFPLIGDVSFSKSDIDALYTCITA